MKDFILFTMILISPHLFSQVKDDLYYLPNSPQNDAKASIQPEVEKIHKIVDNQKVLLYYDLLGNPYTSYQIDVYYLLPNSEVQIKFASGDIGNGILSGKNKIVIIDYNKEGIPNVNNTGYRILVIPDTSSVRNINTLTRKGNNVYIDSDDQGVISHASYELRGWGYWNVVTNKEDADFVLRFNCRITALSADAFAELIDPTNSKVLRVTDHPRGSFLDMNYKKAIIRMLIKQEIIDYYGENE